VSCARDAGFSEGRGLGNDNPGRPPQELLALAVAAGAWGFVAFCSREPSVPLFFLGLSLRPTAFPVVCFRFVFRSQDLFGGEVAGFAALGFSDLASFWKARSPW